MAPVGGVHRQPCLSRFSITNEVSRIGIARITSGATTATAAVVFMTPLIATPARTKPSSIDPGVAHEHPGGVEVEHQEAAHAPARAAAMMAGSLRPSEAARIANVVAPRPLIPAASPSIPSVKLIMFTRATNQSTVSGYCAGPRSPTPRNGSVMWSI